MLQKSTRYWQALEDDSNLILLRKCGLKDFFFKWMYVKKGSNYFENNNFFNQGLRNDFKAAMEKIDQEYLAELIKQQVIVLFD